VTEAIVVLTTTESPEDAERLARLLVARELAACAQVLPPMTSIYRWQGNVARAAENLLLIKTRRELYAAVESAIKANHPYETPEIIALPVQHGSPEYLTWLTTMTHQES